MQVNESECHDIGIPGVIVQSLQDNEFPHVQINTPELKPEQNSVKTDPREEFKKS
jgi:hypothetical protein